MNPFQYDYRISKLFELLEQLKLEYFDARIPSSSRWDSSWDGLHYSMLSIHDQLSPSATCPTGYNRGGRGNHYGRNISIMPGINKIEKGYIFWCKIVAPLYNESTIFNNFEGGVSSMLTMMWMNKICASTS
jgi:hypothetical protein